MPVINGALISVLTVVCYAYTDGRKLYLSCHSQSLVSMATQITAIRPCLWRITKPGKSNAAQ